MNAIRHAGWLLVALGAVVLAGWWAHLPAVVQIVPGAAPMQPNTALGFAIVGIAIVSGRATVALAASLLGALTLAEYAFGSLGIDTLLAAPWEQTETSHPGRMAPNTAAAFAIFPLAMSQREGLATVAGSTVLMLGAMAIVGYSSGVNIAYGWGKYTAMAIHTSVGFVGAGLMALTQRARSGAVNYGVILGVLFSGFVAVYAMTWYSLGFGRMTLSVTVVGALIVAMVVWVARAEKRHRLAVAALEQRERELDDASELMRTYGYTITHDFEKGLRGAAEQLNSIAAQPAECPGCGEHFDRHPALGRVAGRMIQWSELAGGMQELLNLDEDRTTIDMFEPATIAADMLREEAEAVGASIVISPNLPVVEGHRDLILHAVENLLSNAIKYREPSRPLVIEVVREGNATCVRDNGRGFAQSREPDLWVPGRRLHSGTKGRGIGLVAVRRIARHLGGDVTARGEVDVGAEFCVQLPMARA